VRVRGQFRDLRQARGRLDRAQDGGDPVDLRIGCGQHRAQQPVRRLHGDALVTEQPAIFIYLADLFPEAGLAPALGAPLRGPYLRWLAFYGSSFEPAITDLAMKREPTPPMMCPYGDYDTMLATLTARLRAGQYLLGERFSAADVLWGNALGWTTMFKLVPELPEITAYMDRVNSRPAARRAAQADAALAAAQG
jgi:glutathione S-transferase